MPNKAFREAQETFKQALQEGAAQYAIDQVHEVERLLLHAHQLSDVDAREAGIAAEQARTKASALIAVSREEREKLKSNYGSQLASCFHKLSDIKHVLLDIERKVNSSTILSLTQRARILETALAQTRHALDREDFRRVESLLAKLDSYTTDIHELLDPTIQKLSYQMPLEILSRNHQKKRMKR
jgi:hypothetical protein